MKGSHGFLLGLVVMLAAYDSVKWRLALLESVVFPRTLLFGPTRKLLMAGADPLVAHDERDAMGFEEVVSGMRVRHAYLKNSNDRRFHAAFSVETCKYGTVPLVFLHGHMQSWYSMSLMMGRLAGYGYCGYGFDLLGYGQSDVDPAKGEYGWREQATEFADLFKSDPRFRRVFFVAHDRGCIVADYLTALREEGKFEVLGYARCEQSFLLPHALPRPPRTAMADDHVGVELAKGSSFVLGPPFVASGKTHPAFNATRFRREFSFRNMWLSTTIAYTTNSIQEEWNDLCFAHGHPDRLAPGDEGLDFYHAHRGIYGHFGINNNNATIMNCHPDNGGLIANMVDLPLILLQGALDKGMPPWTYFHAADVLPNTQLRFFNAGWFLIIEIPDDIADAIHTFISNHAKLHSVRFLDRK